jgi:putative membrane protein
MIWDGTLLATDRNVLKRRFKNYLIPKTNVMRIMPVIILSPCILFMACSNNNSSSTDNTSSNTQAQMDSTRTNGNTSTTMNSGKEQMSNVMKSDSDFLATAYGIGKFEIQIADMAKKKTTNKDVVSFANMMIKDHTAMNGQVQQMAQQKNVQLPMALPSDLQKKSDKLDKLTGKDFMKEYADVNVDGHKDAISRFEKVANSDCSTEVKNLAANALPNLRKHREHAEMLQKQESVAAMPK